VQNPNATPFTTRKSPMRLHQPERRLAWRTRTGGRAGCRKRRDRLCSNDLVPCWCH